MEIAFYSSIAMYLLPFYMSRTINETDVLYSPAPVLL